MAYSNPYDPRARESRRKWYHANKEKQRAYRNQRIAELKQRVRDYKEANPCIDCGQFYPYYVMHFDHLPEHDKEAEISRAVSVKGWGWDRIKAEMDKCEVVCANCHAVRSHQRRGNIEDTCP